MARRAWAGGAEAHARRDAKASALATALADLDAADLDAARARWERGLTVAKALDEVDRQLSSARPTASRRWPRAPGRPTRTRPPSTTSSR
ncbi:MAG: hypothetical protein H6704_28550 [Myxococcales bacterium]|nr:hypothetical protein [Myxococcales bacterium]